MRNRTRRSLLAIGTSSLLSLVSCGGADQITGIEGTGDQADRAVAAAPVESFGSIYLNGIRFDTRTAEVIINGRVANEDAIELGMLVQVEGEIDTRSDRGTAEKVVYDRALKGVVDTVTDVGLHSKILNVLGQTVLAHADIAYQGTTFDGLQVGALVEVSGLRNSTGDLVATRLEQLPTNTEDSEFDVEGPIQALDAIQQTFHLQQLVVDYSAAVIDGGSIADLADGVFVEVQGEVFESGVMLAQRLRIGNGESDISAGIWTQIEGIVEDFDSVNAFVVGGLPVSAGNARIVRGSASQLAEGMRLAVEGTVDAEGRLNASEVTLKPPSEASVVGPIEDIDAAAGELTIFGVRFETDPATGYEDRSAAGDRFFRLRRLAVGELVQVFSRRVEGRNVVTRIKRLDSQAGETVLTGPVTEVAGNVFYVMNMLINTDGAERAALVAGLSRGDFVKVEGVYSGANAILATAIEIVEPPCAASAGNACADRAKGPR